MNIQTQIKKYRLKITVYQVPSHREPVLLQNIRLVVHSDFEQNQPGQKADGSREFDTLKSKKVPQSLEIGLFFCQIFIFII